MSQKKVDERKKSRGDLLHQTKKQWQKITLIVAVVLVCCGVFACWITYKKAYDKGYDKGGQVTANELGAFYGSLLESQRAETETKADETKSDETKADETKADETKADETKSDETKADETKADETKADETKAVETKAE